MKLCKTCKLEKEETEFYCDKRRKDGLFSECKKCTIIRSKKWFQENREKHRMIHRSYNKAWRKTHLKESCDYRKKRYRYEKLASGEFTKDDFNLLMHKYNNTCLCCGNREPDIKLVADHVIPLALGGSNCIENRQPLCIDCNRRKNARIIDYRNDYSVA